MEIIIEEDIRIDRGELRGHLHPLVVVPVAADVPCGIVLRDQVVVIAVRRSMSFNAAGDKVVHTVADEAHLGRADPGDDIVLIYNVVDAVVVIAGDLCALNTAHRRFEGICEGMGAGGVVFIDYALCGQVRGRAGS